MSLKPSASAPIYCSDWDDLVSETGFLALGRNRYTVSFMLYTDGTYYYAENGTTGALVYGGPNNLGATSGTNGADVFLAAMNALTAGRDYKQRIKVKGSWTFANQINVPSYTVLDLDCRITSGDAANHGVFVLDGVTDIEIYGGTLDGNRTAKTGGGAVFITGVSSRIKVIGMKIESMAGHSIRVQTGTFEDLDIIGNHIYDNAADTDGIYVGATSIHVNIERNILDTIPRAGIAVSGITDFEIVGNRLRDVNRGINLETSVTEGVVSENIIDNTTGTYGIQCRGGSGVTLANRIDIVNNKIASTQTQGIRVDQYAEEIRIDGNTIILCPVGIYASGTSIGVVTVTDNDTLSCTEAGIRVDSEGIVEGNLAEGCGTGGVNHGGIRLHNVSNVSVWGNRVYNNDQYGIYETGTSDNNVIQNNEIRGSATTDCVIVGASTAVHKLVVPFVEPVGTAAWDTTAPTGIEVDAAAEGALVCITLPKELQQMIRITYWAVGLAGPGVGNQMHVEVIINGGQADETYNAEAVAIANLDSNETDFAINDIISWTFDSSDDSDIGDFAANECLEIFAIYEAAVAADIATDALFRCVEIEYV